MMWRRLVIPTLVAFLWLPSQPEPATADMPMHAICRVYVAWALMAHDNLIKMDESCGLQNGWWENYQ